NIFTGTLEFPLPNSEEVNQLLTLVDIDGDGLPDKLIKKGDDFKYRRNIGGVFFSNQLFDVEHFKEISSTKTRTSHKPGFAFNAAVYKHSESHSKSVSESNIFMTDVNADGLVDYLKDKIVYFNRIDPNSGKPTFTDDSSLTPNRIIKEEDVDNDVLAPLPDLRLNNDLMDVVKVWVAPKDGKVNITGTISKQFVSSDDGVRFSVEHSSRFFNIFNPGGSGGGTIPINPNPIGGGPIVSDTLIGIVPTSNYIIDPSLLVVNSMATNASNV